MDDNGVDIVMDMGIKDDVLAGIGEIIGAESAEQVIKNFDDPKKYPRDFLDEYLFFMQKLIGVEAAEKKVNLLYRKYRVKSPLGTKAISSARTAFKMCSSSSSISLIRHYMYGIYSNIAFF